MNKLSKEEIKNIYRIEYMPNSNWDMGLNRKIWILEINKDKVKRSIYIGKPLVPEYTETTYDSSIENEQQFERTIYEGKLYFNNNYNGLKIIQELEKRKIWEWDNVNEGYTIDGMNYDIAFYTKDKDGNEKICRYQFFEESLKEEDAEYFDSLFSTTKQIRNEKVDIAKDIIDKSLYLLPGGEKQN